MMKPITRQELLIIHGELDDIALRLFGLWRNENGSVDAKLELFEIMGLISAATNAAFVSLYEETDAEVG